MDFEWDEAKRFSNIAKHGLDFIDAYQIFDLPMFVVEDDREDYGETRYEGIGFMDGNFVVVVYTELNETTIRIISLRRASSKERRIYEREA